MAAGLGIITHEGMHGLQSADDNNLYKNNRLPDGNRCLANLSLCLDVVSSTMSILDYEKSSTGHGYYVQERELPNQVVSHLSDKRNFSLPQGSIDLKNMEELINYYNTLKSSKLN